MQNEIVSPTPLLDTHGNLVQRGWARQPILDCNLEQAAFYAIRPLQFLRVKQWDYYAIFTPTHFISATVADIGYAGNIFVYLVDFTKPWYHEEGVLTPFGQGVSLPRNSTSGDVVFDNGKTRVSFVLGQHTRRLQVSWPNFDGGKGIEADILLTILPAHESVVMATPIGQKRFYYNRKINCLPASGWFTYDGGVLSWTRPSAWARWTGGEACGNTRASGTGPVLLLTCQTGGPLA